MGRILLLYESVIPTVVMIGKTISKFAERYGLLYKEKNIKQVTKIDIIETNVIISVRGESPLMAGILECSKGLGKKNIFFLDDDLLGIADGGFRYPKRKKWLLECIKKCDILMTSNQLIADDYGKFVLEERTCIVHTDVDEQEICVPLERDSKVKIVYAASPQHTVYFDKFVHPVFGKIIKKYGHRISFYFIGVNPQIEQQYQEYTHFVSGMPYDKYQEYMKNERFEIGIAPLEVNHFTACKYFNKFLDYTKNGVCGLYSDCMPYQMVVKNGENGYLVSNTSESWYDAIVYVIENRKRSKECVENAQNYIKENHCQDVIFSKLKEDIPELLTYTSYCSGRNNKYIKYKMRHKIFRLRESCYLGIYSVKNYGVIKTCGRIKNKLSCR